jgi:hypothetical protein
MASSIFTVIGRNLYMDIEKYKNLDKEQLKAMVLLRQKIEQEGARTNFMRFVKAVWPLSKDHIIYEHQKNFKNFLLTKLVA